MIRKVIIYREEHVNGAAIAPGCFGLCAASSLLLYIAYLLTPRVRTLHMNCVLRSCSQLIITLLHNNALLCYKTKTHAQESTRASVHITCNVDHNTML
jgi:hypothetical protein